jgi:hypothetical protein
MTVAVDMRQLMTEQDREPVVVGDMEIFHNLQIAAALALEINTGLKHSRGSARKLAARMCGSYETTKVGVLKDYVAWLTEWFEENHEDKPHYTPNPSVRRAMEK